MVDDDLAQWLAAQPLDEAVEMDGEMVYLKLHPLGAELGGWLYRDTYRPDQLRDALAQGFASAMMCEAGLAQGLDGQGLALTQWLPGVRSWSQAVEQLENLLDQLSVWRAALAPGESHRTAMPADRNEHRLRKLLAGAGQ